MSHNQNAHRIVIGAAMASEVMDYLVNPPPSIRLNKSPQFTDLIGGFRKSEFTILCGSTGSGKSSLLANWSADFCEQKIKHLVIAVENGPIDHLARVLSVLENEDLNSGDAMHPDVVGKAISNHMGTVFGSHLQLSTHDDRIPLAEILQIMKAAVNEGCEIVFIDNVNFLLEPVHDKNMVVEMDRVIHELVVFCKQNPIHLVMVMHPKKTDGDNGRIISEFDIKGSSTAVQESSNIFLFNKPKSEIVADDPALKTFREVLIKKCRRKGRNTGKAIIYDGTKQQYKEVSEAVEFYRLHEKGSSTNRSNEHSRGNLKGLPSKKLWHD